MGKKYYDRRTGITYDELPEWAIKVSDTPEEYQKEYYRKYGSSTVQPNSGKQLEKADAREVEKTLGDEYASQYSAGNILQTGLFNHLNFLSPSQHFGATINAFQGEGPGNNWWSNYINNMFYGNSGFVSDKFAKKHPWWAIAVNGLGDGITAKAAITGFNAGINKLNKYPNIVAKLRHPTYELNYHNTPYDFPIKEAWLGTEYDMGLHMTPNKQIAESFGGITKKIWIPKKRSWRTQSIDLHDNGVRHLSNDIQYNRDQILDAAGNDLYRFDLIRKYGGKPKWTTYSDFTGNTHQAIEIRKDVSIPLRNEIWKNMPQTAQRQADNLLDEYNSVINSGLDDIIRDKRLAQINEQAAKLFSDNGIKIIDYNNASATEGSGGLSRMVLDPSIIYEHTPFQPIKNEWNFPLSSVGGINGSYGYYKNKP